MLAMMVMVMRDGNDDEKDGNADGGGAEDSLL